MALHHNPRIPTSGLVQLVDAANPKSYPGAGSTWFDLTPNNHDISLGAGVSLTTSGATKVLQFAEDDTGYGRNTSMNLASSNFTVISWVRKLSNGNDGRTITAYNNNWLLAHHDNTYGDYYAEGWVHDIGSPPSDTIWRMFTGTGHISNDQYSLYINDVLVVNNSNAGAQGPNGWNLNNQYGQYSNCQIANLICYNRVLSAEEVKLVYDSTKTRFI